ncbi:MBL fold metallo-hydrolase [Scrofimicrobium sp. R131]|uniref:MBL fold metallo-hydrolase n=1 Tax=Scrofimicrobium appendicitidis TaxID=3079930 RepID=A0AAU7V584_9ACTO
MAKLQIETLPTDLFDANCYLLFEDGSDQVVVVDPGLGAFLQVNQRLSELGKRVGAVLLTHGHPDHVWEAAQVAGLGGENTPTYIPGPDRDWLRDPLGQLGFDQLTELPTEWVEPERVEDAPTGSWEILPHIYLNLLPAPGHSRGSAVVLIGGQVVFDGQELQAPTAFSADVIFAGSVGRTDLPGGDETEMRESLRTLANALDPHTVLLPGHGPKTTWGQELESNPYVRRAAGLKH